MNNRSAQSAAGPRAAETYIVDLTTVCLSSGTLRLPLSLLGRFSEGQHRVSAGGEELTIEFEAPRTLSGLAPFFKGCELRANDRVRFVFDGASLVLEAHKRERPRSSSAAASAPLNASLSAAVGGSNGGAERAPSKASVNGGARLPQRGLFAEPSQLLDPSAQIAQDALAAEDTVAATASAEPQHAPAENSVKAVRRVRIEGGEPPRTNTVTPRPLDRASAHDVWARRQQPSWRALDTMVAGPVIDPEEAAEAFSDSIVRVVRRSKGTITPLAAEIPPLKPKAAPEAREERPVSYSMSWPLPETPREKPKARPADGPAPRPARESRANAAAGATPNPYLDPYLDAPIDADTEQYAASTPTILESDLLSLPTSGRWREASEEAYHKYQEAQHASAEPVAVPAGRRGILGRLGFGRAAKDGALNGAGAGNGAATDQPSWPGAAPTTAAPASDSATRATGGGTGAAAAASQPAANTAKPAAPAKPTPVYQASGQQLLIVDESVYDVDFETAAPPQTALKEEPMGSIEDDMAALNALLRQPDIPAIVRCDDLAARLRISPERVSRAMLRLSEDRERFTPLRGDAYMVRRGA